MVVYGTSFGEDEQPSSLVGYPVELTTKALAGLGDRVQARVVSSVTQRSFQEVRLGQGSRVRIAV